MVVLMVLVITFMLCRRFKLGWLHTAFSIVVAYATTFFLLHAIARIWPE